MFKSKLDKFSEAFQNITGWHKKEEEPDHTAVTLYGKIEDHSSDEHGKFKHPFLSQSSNVSQIYYPDSKVLSFKMQAPERMNTRTRLGVSLDGSDLIDYD